MNLKTLITPALIATIILGLVTYTWTGLDAKVEKNTKQIEDKVSKDTLKEAIVALKEQNKIHNEQQKTRQESVDKHLDQLYKELLRRGN